MGLKLKEIREQFEELKSDIALLSDLCDDVLTNIKEEKPTVSSGSTLEKSASSSSLGSSSAPARRYQVYVGNLTWWTTDADIADAVLSVGVNDFLEVKFYENRANGQSKGKLQGVPTPGID